MKKDIHPQYNPVVFVDITTGRRFITHSTVRSPKTEVIDGVEHFVVSCGITSDSHPFFTGKNQFVDTEGRIDKFQKRFGAVRRSGGKLAVRKEKRLMVTDAPCPINKGEQPPAGTAGGI